MTDYINPSIPVDRGEIRQIMVDEFQARTGATVAAATVWDVLFDVVAGIAGDLGEQATEVTNIIFRRYGEKIMRILPVDAVPATGQITITADTNGPYLVPAGTELSIATLDGDRIAYFTTADATVPNGSTTATNVPIVCGVTGEDGNSITAGPRLETSLTGIQSITVTAAPAGGQDPETDDDYINRLADLAPLQAITLVLPDDFARYSRNFPGVEAALALDLYDAPTDTPNTPGVITVAVRDMLGVDPGTSVRDALLTALTDLSISDLDVYVIPPTETDVTVTRVVVPYPGWSQVDADANADAAIANLYDKTRWGLLPFGDQKIWVETTVARYQDLVTAVNNAEGVSHYTTLTLNGGTVDATLTGPAAIPNLT